MSDKNLPGELYDQLEPGSQSISPNHFTANTAASDNSAASQRARILEALRHGPLTTQEARRELDVMHPAARVQELREQGHSIVTHWTWDETRRGRKHRMAQYVLVIEPGVRHGG